MVGTIVALDIETTGLDPDYARVLAVALSMEGSDDVSADDDERDLLDRVETTISSLPAETILVSWNGEAFDLPFLRRRFDALDVPTSLQLTSTGLIGKYGQPRFAARWGGRRHVDVAYLYKERAAELGVEWSLKPVAKALGHRAIEVDRRGRQSLPCDQRIWRLMQRPTPASRPRSPGKSYPLQSQRSGNRSDSFSRSISSLCISNHTDCSR